jgi:hypothetical protein
MVQAAVTGGRLLATMDKASGGEAYHEHPSHRATGAKVSTLADLGFTRSRASRWVSLQPKPTHRLY